jgi:hypothetical protein
MYRSQKVSTGLGSMDFNSSVQDWARSRPFQLGNEFTGFIKGQKLLDHINPHPANVENMVSS